MAFATAIGIDLGSVNSRVSIWYNDHVKVLENAFNERSMASFVSFTETKRLVGNQAKERVSANTANTIYNLLRLVSRKYTKTGLQQVQLQDTIKQLPFKVVNVDDKPVIQVEHKGITKKFTPLEILAMIISKLKKQAEAHIGRDARIRDAVIIIPVAFSNGQRQAMMDAAAIAGLRVQRFVSGSTAATLLYSFNRKNRMMLGGPARYGGYTNGRYRGSSSGQADENSLHMVLAFDFGGGSLDATLAEICGDTGVLQVRATAGNAHLGGQDIDERVLGYLARDIQNRFGRDITTNLRAMSRLRESCERAKRILSTNQSTKVELDGLAEGIDYYEKMITRAGFEEMCADLLSSTLQSVDQVLGDANIRKEDVHEYILLGGSSRIPRIVKILSDYFNGREPNKTVDTVEAAVCGAGIQAAILCSTTTGQVNGMLLLDVVPASLGIEITGGVMEVLIKRNAAIPTKRSNTYTTNMDDQPGIILNIFEGESARVANNDPLGQFRLMGVPPAPKGAPQFNVTLEVDILGILEVSAMECWTGNKAGFEVINRLSIEEIDRLKFETRVYDDEEEAAEASTIARNDLEEYAYGLKNSLELLQSEVARTLSWLEQVDNTAGQEAFEEAKARLQENVRKLVESR